MRKIQLKFRPFAAFAFSCNFGFVILQNLFDDDQTQSRAAPAFFGRVKRLKNILADFFAHSNAVVGKFDGDFVMLKRCRNFQFPAVGHCIQSILDEI